ncbi:uncharacterized protein LACBIDRAFT_326731 [Laccaria bicolor S238N-H82]|uniref:Predicted protein n=1 Tax=Laccaria bicolor (strain S238N-H82 / ATCC MYA-4686) TaxID=486041 RepID=B0D9H6_LACBS|nr:uncharacterized protein LACBIDRAFT_326731 [Laccaria bicolor S238N-H82]EDR08582.1 predicted protein [Laccaria bicolor S238N-H82]|eukprot:XP_001880807.1 predicted protein [Laccaria bicolor S238N-H82]
MNSAQSNFSPALSSRNSKHSPDSLWNTPLPHLNLFQSYPQVATLGLNNCPSPRGLHPPTFVVSDAAQDEETNQSSSPLSSAPSSPMNTPRRRAMSLPPLSSPSVIQSSPVVGSKEERLAIKRRKSARKRQMTLATSKAIALEVEEESQKSRLENVLRYLENQDVSLGEVNEYVFDPHNGQGSHRWDGFFREHGRATRILNWWVASSNSMTAWGEVHEWAVQYVANAVSREAGAITRQGILRKPIIDNGFVEDFSFENLYQSLRNQFATVTTCIFESLATSSRQLASGLTPARMGKKRMVITSSILACLGEYSLFNNVTKRMMALYLYATGSQRQPITVLSHLGISESYANLVAKIPSESDKTSASSVSDSMKPKRIRKVAGTLKQLSDFMRQKARDVAATGLYGVVYDNINFMAKTAEQIIGRKGL